MVATRRIDGPHGEIESAKCGGDSYKTSHCGWARSSRDLVAVHFLIDLDASSTPHGHHQGRADGYAAPFGAARAMRPSAATRDSSVSGAHSMSPRTVF